MISSSFVQLTPYCLLEYKYSSNEYLSSQVKLARLKNLHDSGQILFLNAHSERNTTGNILDFSAAKIQNNDWVILDRDVATPYISQDSNLTYSDLSLLLSSLSVKYDTLRFHIQSGYNFDNIQGFLLKCFVRQSQTELDAYLTSSVVLKGTDRFFYNPRPIFITDKFYDKYIDILIPSVKSINENFYADVNNIYSIGYQYTTDNRGILPLSNIYVNLAEIYSTRVINGITFFKTDQEFTSVFNQEDKYGDIAATIIESSEGDFFEYYASVDGEFPDEFINNMNSLGGNYVIVHLLNVIEQIDTRFINTSSFTQVQSSQFDEPLLFRPILKYAGISVSFSIDYTIRIYNTENGFSITKSSSISSFSPMRYGKNIERIQVSQTLLPQKIYNKVFTNTPISIQKIQPIQQFTTIYVPVFYDTKNIILSLDSLVSETNTNVSQYVQDINFAQGDARIYLSDFDQYFKFTIKKLDNLQKITLFDLSNMKLYIAFYDISDNIFKYEALGSSINVSAKQGEVVFKIPAEARKKMGLDGSSIKTFYIISQNSQYGETKLYVGTVDIDKNVSNEIERVENISVKVSKDALTEQSEKPTINSDINSAFRKNDSIKDQIGNAIFGKQETYEQFNMPVSIPNLSIDTGAQLVKKIKPVREKTENINPTQTNNGNLSQTL